MNTRQFPRTRSEEKNDSAATAAATKARRQAEAAHDATLVQRFNGGDESAFNEIVSRFYPRIRALTLQTLHNEADADEVTQDTFIRAHRGLAKFRGDSSLTTWLYCIAINLSRNRYWYLFRRRWQDNLSIDQTILDGSDSTFAEVVAAGPETPRSETVRGEFVSLVAACLAKLDATHREILTMRTVLDQSYEEIATALQINLGTVKSRIARARESLRELLVEAAPDYFGEKDTGDFFELLRELPRPTAGWASA